MLLFADWMIFAMNITNNFNLPQQIVSAVSRDHVFKPKRYSVTSLLKGVRQSILERRHGDQITRDASDMIWALFGSAVHKILEESEELPEELKEEYVIADVAIHNGGVYQLSGYFDSYNDVTKTVTDWKTCSVWRVVYDDWDEYRKQLLMYCWILRTMGFDAQNGQIVAILKDHSKTKAKVDSSYPQHPVFVKKFEFTQDDFEEIEQFINSRFNDIATAEGLPDESLPLCSPAERWQTDTKYAVMKKGRKRAIKLYDSAGPANMHAAEIGGYVEIRPGESKRCKEYCDVCEFCNYYNSEVKQC